MKKVVSLVLVVAIMLSSVGLVACGGGEGVTPPPPSEGETAPPPSEEEAPPPSGGAVTWNDVPIYSGAKQVQKASWSIPPAEGEEWSKMEWRYYETGDDVGTVTAFYKSQMPGKGWEEMGWMEAQGMSWGYYSKNNEQDGAMVWIGAEEGETFFALMRATK